jgi:hypothetical protein
VRNAVDVDYTVRSLALQASSCYGAVASCIAEVTELHESGESTQCFLSPAASIRQTKVSSKRDQDERLTNIKAIDIITISLQDSLQGLLS